MGACRLQVADAQLPTGAMPHHFQDASPVFKAISGANQPATNLFWTKAALRYVAETGDVAWLTRRMPTIERAMAFLLATLGAAPEPTLIRTEGALFVDVLRRGNYSAETNAFAVHVLGLVADAWEFVGNRSMASDARAAAAAIGEALNTWLWSVDHFVTQRNLDNSTRDFVDYDANLLAGVNTQCEHTV